MHSALTNTINQRQKNTKTGHSICTLTAVSYGSVTSSPRYVTTYDCLGNGGFPAGNHKRLANPVVNTTETGKEGAKNRAH